MGYIEKVVSCSLSFRSPTDAPFIDEVSDLMYLYSLLRFYDEVARESREYLSWYVGVAFHIVFYKVHSELFTEEHRIGGSLEELYTLYIRRKYHTYVHTYSEPWL